MSDVILDWPNIAVPLITRTHDFDSHSERTAMESGRSRNRRRAEAPQETINVRWNFILDEFDTFRAFFEEDLVNGTLKFRMVTYGPSSIGGMLRQTAWVLSFLEPRYSFARADNNFAVSAVLEVHSKIRIEVSNPPPVFPPPVDPPPSEIIAFKFFDGPVYCMEFASNAVYVSGRFTKYGTDEDGWTNCLGIARIHSNGEIDTSFKPGGVEGGGFAISGGYFAPSQLQLSTGGILVGNSYGYLREPRLYENRGETGRFDVLRLNGVNVPPVIKLLADGTRDAALATDYISVSPDDPKFMAFHAFERVGRIYLTYQEDITCEIENGEDFSQTNCAVLRCHSWGGSLLFRLHTFSGLSLAGFEYARNVFIDEWTNKIYWCGLQGSLYGAPEVPEAFPLFRTVDADNPEVVEPLDWKTPRIIKNTVSLGLVVLDYDLNLLEPENWSGWNLESINADIVQTAIPIYLTRGCFFDSIAGSMPVDDSPDQGRFRNGNSMQHKGGFHYSFSQVFGPYSMQEGVMGAGSFSLSPVGDSNAIFIYGGGSFGSGFELLLDRDDWETPQQIQNSVGFQAYNFFQLPVDYPRGTMLWEFGPSVGFEGAKWRVITPAVRPMSTTITDLWDLRGIGDIENPDLHGFSVFGQDWDGCANVRVLNAQTDPTRKYADNASAYLDSIGIFFTGMIEKFKGATVFTVDSQLAKIRHDGEWMGEFQPPIFGPAVYPLKRDIASGIDEDHHAKVMYARLSASQRVLYVTGKFISLDPGNSTERIVGNIICLDANTGEVLS